LRRTKQATALLAIAAIWLMERTVFQDRELAKHVLMLFLGINDQMDRCVASIEKRTSPEEQRAFKKGVGQVMCEVFDKIVEPIGKRHPSLRPPEMEGG
jgi:hypothetical protein